MRHLALPHLAFLICSIWLCRKLLCFIYLLATGSAAYHLRQCRSQHRRRNQRPPVAKGQALRGARLKALLALDFCPFMRGRSCKSPDSQHATTDTCRSTQGPPDPRLGDTTLSQRIREWRKPLPYSLRYQDSNLDRQNQNL